MTIEKRKKQRRARLIAAGVILLAASSVILFLIDRFAPTKKHMDPASYFAAQGDGAAVVVDGVRADAAALSFDGDIYPDYETVAEQLNPSVFYDETDQLLIVTTPTRKNVYPIEDGQTEGGEAVLSDGTLYISLGFLSDISDLRAEVFEEPLRAVIVTEDGYTGETVVKKGAAVRYRAGIKSPILEDLEEGTVVRTTDIQPDGEADPDKIEGWTHVVTAGGYAGYVQDRFLADPQTYSYGIEKKTEEYTTLHLEEFVNMAFHQTTSQAANNKLQDMLSSVTGVNVLAPTWFFLDSTDGALADLTSTSYVEEAHDRGIQVWAVMNDFDGEVSSSSATAEALMTDASRSAMIDAVLEGLRNCGADGLCIDFEHVTDKSVSDFLEFVRECSGAMRTEGKVLSVCNYVPTFTKYMNRKEQGRVVDYVITMCYDEHTSGSKEAGSVASYGFVRDGIEDTAEDVPPEKLIAAIPFYTRLWETKGSEAPSSTAYGMSDAQKAVDAAGMTTVWDDTARQYYAEKDSGNVRMQIWLEEARSVSEKMSLIRKAGCAGVAEWKLGFETDDIWEVISEESPD